MITVHFLIMTAAVCKAVRLNSSSNVAVGCQYTNEEPFTVYTKPSFSSVLCRSLYDRCLEGPEREAARLLLIGWRTPKYWKQQNLGCSIWRKKEKEIENERERKKERESNRERARGVKTGGARGNGIGLQRNDEQSGTNIQGKPKVPETFVFVTSKKFLSALLFSNYFFCFLRHF
jgi:hypothetical protein